MSLVERLTLAGLLCACTALLIVPLWIPTIPPLTDFGGHVKLADWWVRLDHDAGLAELLERRGSLTNPNLLMVRFAALMHPMMSVTAGLKLFASLVLVAQVGAQLALLRTLGRSPWLVFASLPFLWNGMFALGVLNYIAVLPIMILLLVAALRLGREPSWSRTAQLALIGVAGFWVHALGTMLILPVAGVALLLSGRWRTIWRGTLAFVPAVAWFGGWMLATRSGGSTGLHIIYLPLWERLKMVRYDALNVLTNPYDNRLLDVIVATWAIAACLLVWRWHRARRRAGQSEVVSARPRMARRLLAQAQAHPSAVLAAVTGLLVVFLPTYMMDGGMPIGPRLTPIFWFLAASCLPIAGGLFARGLGATMVVVSVVLGAVWIDAVSRYEHQTFAPLLEVVEHIPDEPGRTAPGVWCARTGWHRHWHRLPLAHSCAAVVQTVGDAWSGPGFAQTEYNAVTLRDPTRGGPRFGYAIVYGDPKWVLPNHASLELLHRAGGEHDVWSLYAL